MSQEHRQADVSATKSDVAVPTLRALLGEGCNCLTDVGGTMQDTASDVGIERETGHASPPSPWELLTRRGLQSGPAAAA